MYLPNDKPNKKTQRLEKKVIETTKLNKNYNNLNEGPSSFAELFLQILLPTSMNSSIPATVQPFGTFNLCGSPVLQ